MHARPVLVSVAALLLVCVATASAAEGLYLSATGAYTQYNDSKAVVGATDLDIPFDVDDGWGALGAVGWDFGALRLEAEGGYRQNDMSVGFVPAVDGTLNLTSAMANVYGDIPLTENLQMYVGAGAGQVYSDFDLDVGGKETDDSFCYQAMAGLAVELDHLTFFGGYRIFVINDDLDAGTLTIDSPIIHALEAGVRFTF